MRVLCFTHHMIDVFYANIGRFFSFMRVFSAGCHYIFRYCLNILKLIKIMLDKNRVIM